ncbi:MAG: hypothetical protein ACI837_002838 [Crocinitomicaceae bacterium]|jgi:hypothetical protein
MVAQGKIRIENHSKTSARVTIKCSRPNPIPIIGLSIPAIAGIAVPFIIFGILVEDGKGLKFGAVLGVIVFWAIAYYMVRIILWNVRGKEVITLNSSTILYEAFAGPIKISSQTLTQVDCKNLPTVKLLNGNLIWRQESKQSPGRILIAGKQQGISTKLSVPREELKSALQQLRKIISQLYT